MVETNNEPQVLIKHLQEELERSQVSVQEKDRLVNAYLQASKAVLNLKNFEDTARKIFDICISLVGATSGYIALLSDEGDENEVLFLEAGGRECTVDPELPMPIRGLRARSYESGKAVYDNDFMHSEWVNFMPGGHVVLDNVMFAPLVIDNKTVGIMGIANKATDFTDLDAELASVFGDLAAIALQRSYDIEKIVTAEKDYHDLFYHAPNAYFTLTTDETIAQANLKALSALEYQTDQLIDHPFIDLIPDCDNAKQRYQDLIQRSSQKQGGVSDEFQLTGSDGQLLWFNLTANTDLDTDGNISQIRIIAVDISEIKNAQHEQQRLAEELQRSNKELDQFAYSVSHDLQEPLRMISSYLELLDKRYAQQLDDNAREFIAFAVEGAQRMRRMINGLLSYARVSTRGREFETVNLNQVLSETLQNLHTAIEDNKASVIYGPLPNIQGDVIQIGQVFQNLISNAIKFHSEALPTIEISYEEQPQEYIFKISDNGIGFDANKYSEQIFTVFRRLHTREDYEGTGIGLSTCKKIIERHHGKIWVNSTPGQGSDFYFSIPK